jgi:thioredoxin:protein disulfide reductase
MSARLFLLVILLLQINVFANEDIAKLNPISARGFLKSSHVKVGELIDLQVELNVQDGFFAYSDRFQLRVKKPMNTTVGELNISPIVEFDDTVSKKRKKGLKNTGTITTQIEFPKDLIEETKNIDFELTYIACTHKFCLTPRIINFSVPVDLVDQKKILEKNEIGTTEFIQKQIESNLVYALILLFFFGLLTSLTPCIYPLIPITLAILGTHEKRSQFQSFLISLSYVLGIGLTYALLGVVAAQTGQLFGSLISHPIVIIFMSLIFFLMGLSLLGLFEMRAPLFLQNKMNNLSGGKGYPSAFISGLFAGVIASPCVGPVLVGVLAYIAKTQNSLLGFILLFTFAMGFGVLFILLGTFSQLANRIPRSGAWMNSIKTILALCLFSLSFYYAWPLIKNQLPQKQHLQVESEINWQPYSQPWIAKAKQEKRPIIIDFYADWCAACLELDEITFTKKSVIERSQNFIMLKVDATSPTDEIQALTSEYKVYGLPTILFIDSTGTVREDLTLTGFEEEADFIKRMDAITPDLKITD